MRKFDTGATRDVDTNKFDYEGFLSPLVLEAFAAYMHKNRVQADGNVRDSDNWQKGIPKDAYMKSAFRHFMDFWKEHRGIPTEEGLEQALTALLFNVMGYLHEVKKEKLSKAEGPEAEDGPWLAGWEERSVVLDRDKQHNDAWRLKACVGDGNFSFAPVERAAPVINLTHRYGALAHDAEAIEDEASESETIRQEYENLYRPRQVKISTTSDNPAFPRASGMEHG